MTDDSPLDAARRDGRTTLTESEAKTWLADAGISIPDHRVVSTADDAVAAAAAVGYPVVVKVSSPSIAHKSEWGDGVGVAVGLDAEEAVRNAAERILDAADRRDEGVELLVEQAVDADSGVEVIVGGVRDPSFGPTVLVGLGGIHAEVLEDVSHRLAPIEDEEGRRMIAELDAVDVLYGHRTGSAVDVDALVDVIRTVGDLLVGHDGVAEVDVNPLLATADRMIALDAFVAMDE